MPAYWCEFVGMLLIVFNALAWNCWNFGAGSPIVQWVPDQRFRLIWQALCITVGAIVVTYSPLGERSGGHLNPAITLSFWLLNKISNRHALMYMLMQILGAFAGTALVWCLWTELTGSINGGITKLATGITPLAGFSLEAGMTFLLMLSVLVMVNSYWTQWTGVMASLLFMMLYINTVQLTGASLNPAQSFAPAALLMFWENQWIYWLAPSLGGILSVLLYSQGMIGTGKSYCCKLYHTSRITCHHRRCGYGHSDFIDDFTNRRN